MGILIGFSYINRPSAEELARQQRYRDSIVQVEKDRIAQELLKKAEDSISKANLDTLLVSEIENDSIKNLQLSNLYGDFASSGKGEAKEIVIENNKLKVVLNSKGAQISSVQIKGYKTYSGDSLQIVKQDSGNEMNLDFYNGNRAISTKDLFFEAQLNSLDNKSVVFKAKAGDDKWLEYSYSLTDDSYLLDFTISFHNLEGVIKQNLSYLDFSWNQNLPILERGNDWEIQNSGLYYKYLGDDVESKVVTDEVSENLNSSTKWIAYKGQYFSSVIISKTAFPNATITAKKTKLNRNLLYMTSKIAVPNNFETDSMTFYFGPNKYHELSEIAIASNNGNSDNEKLELDKLVPLGWGIFGWVNRWLIIPLFNFLESIISNYGLIILIMTVIIKMLVLPMVYKSYQSSAKMRALKPMVEEINQKYPKQEDAMKKQQAVMDLYKRAGANPMGGCLPLLLQMPIWYALFRFFPASIELRQQSFLWASDLSSYDSILDLPFSIPWYGDHISLFTLLMAVCIFLSTKINSGQMDTGQQMPGMKLMFYIMPVMMLLWFNNYSSGLSYYYFLSNVITIIQTVIIRKYFVDEKALLEKMKAKADKNAKAPKKSGFMARLEEAQRRQLEQMKKNQKRK
ncbi:MAG: membrane protein insertase YidC [Bacteroidales bacterium]|nr:membrane protein insertase YidC [Bacteroidales bacterium]